MSSAGFIESDDLPPEFLDLIEGVKAFGKVQDQRERGEGLPYVRPPFRAVLLNSKGMGEELAIQKLGEALRQADLVADAEPAEVNLRDLPALLSIQGDESLREGPAAAGREEYGRSGFTKASGRLLVIRQGQSQLKEDERPNERESATTSLKELHLLAEEPWRHPAVLLVGDEDLERLLAEDPEVSDAFQLLVEFRPPSPERVANLVESSLKESGYDLNDEARTELALEVGKRGDSLRLDDVSKISLAAALKHGLRGGVPTDSEGSTSTPEIGLLQEGDFEYRRGSTRSREEILAEFDGLIGLDEVKKQVDLICSIAAERAAMAASGKEIGALDRAFHFVFRGPPGTGKTTVARLIGELFHSLGLLDRGHTLERDRSSLIADFSGQTENNVRRAINQAKGGVLFIDEAYALVEGQRGGGDYGQRAVDALVAGMTREPGSFICVVAGYDQPMDDFLRSNPGLASRFNQEVNFRSMTPEELVQVIELRMGQQHTRIAEDSRDRAVELMEEVVRSQDPSYFGNAREAINVADSARDLAEPSESGVKEIVDAAALEAAVNRLFDRYEYSPQGSAVQVGSGRSGRSVDPALVEQALGAIKLVEAIDPDLGERLEQRATQFEQPQGPDLGFGLGLPRKVVDILIPTTDKKVLVPVAEAFAALYRDAGLLRKGEVIEASPDLEKGKGSVELVEEDFGSARGSALVISDLRRALGSSSKDADRAAQLGAIFSDQMRRDRDHVLVVAGLDGAIENGTGVLRPVLAEFEYSPF